MQMLSHTASSLPLAGLACLSICLSVPASAQSDLSSRMQPITSEVRNAGTLHLATGTWTRARGSSQAALGAGDLIVYANTCSSGYYAGQPGSGMETWTDEGLIPDTGQPRIPSTLIPGSFDADLGCAAAYNITGFQIAYCTYHPAFSTIVRFHDNYLPPSTLCAVPGTPTASFALTGLPASTPGILTCWTVNVDIAGAGNFTLTGTGSNLNRFGWGFSTTSISAPPTEDGMIVAGVPATCSGSDATRWDRGTSNFPNYPGNQTPGAVLPTSNEQGTGMLTLDAFRVDCVSCGSAGCHFFGGQPLASFHLELYSDVNPCADLVLTNAFCTGATGCPCGLNSPNSGTGCNNESNTGGAVLTVSGNASVGADLSAPALFVTLGNAPAFKTSIFIQGTAVNAPMPFGDGLRCVSGSLVRLNAPPPPPAPGDPTDATGSLTYPTANHPLSITQRSQQAAQPIAAGDTRHYFAQYRDPSPNGCSVSLGGTVNTSNAFTVVWGL